MSNSLQANINQEFATLMVAKQKKEQQSFGEHEQKCLRVFEKAIPSHYPPSQGSNHPHKHRQDLTPVITLQVTQQPLPTDSPAPPPLTAETTELPIEQPATEETTGAITHMEV